MSENKFKCGEYDIKYGDIFNCMICGYDAYCLNFYIEKKNKYFTYKLGIEDKLIILLIKQDIIPEYNNEDKIIDAFKNIVISKLNEPKEENLKFLYEIDKLEVIKNYFK